MKQNVKPSNTSREVILTESKTMRDGYIKEEQYYDVLDKIKAIPYLTKDMIVSTEQIANYYEVSTEAIKTVIKRHRDELEEDGIITMVGEELKEFKQKLTEVHGATQLPIGKRTANLTILTKRAMLRIGMLLTTSNIAKLVRSHLLDCEEQTSQEKQIWIAKREAGKIDRKRMTTAIANYIPDSPNKKWKYPEYTNMVYQVLFNKTAKQMREERGFTKNDALRDSFTGDELMKVDESETIVTALVTLGFDKDYIREQLQKKFIKQLNTSNNKEVLK
jgi:hypothetical protein